MKLHLPKQLFTALLAAITLATPAWGLSITASGNLETITLNADEAYQGYNFTYTLSGNEGTLTKNGGNWGDSLTLNFTLNDTASSCTSSTGLVYANAANSANIGLQLHDKDGDGAVEIAGRWNHAYWDNTNNTSSEIKEGATYTLNLAMGESTNWTDGSDTTYTATGLNTSGSNFNNVVYNKTYVDTFEAQEFENVTVSNAGGSWSQEFDREAVVNATSGRYQIGGSGGVAAPDESKTIVVGGSGQLFLQTWGGTDIELNNNIILGATNHADGATYGTLRFGNDGGFTTTITGDITIVEDVLMAATTSDNAINLNGTVSGDYILSLKGVGYKFSGEVDVKGLNLATGAAAQFGKLTIGSTIANNGTLKLNDSLTANDAGVFLLAATGTGLNTGGNGFYENVTYALASGTGTVTIGEGVLLTLGSGETTTSPTLLGSGTNTVYFNEAADAGTYYIFADTGTSSVETAVNTRKESETDFTLSAIYVNSGSTLSYDSGSFTGVSLKGNGIYDAGASKTMTSGISLNPAWCGTVKISNSTDGADIMLNNLGVAGSTVDISGVSGYFQSGSSTTEHAIIAPNINLSGDLTITNSYSGSFYEFHGKLSGTGNLNLQRSGGPTNTFYFMNDISGWSGTLNHTSRTDNIYLQGTANDIKAAFNRTGGTLNLYVETNAAATFEKAVSVSNLTLNQNATFKNALTVVNAATISSAKKMTVDGSYTASFTGTLTNRGTLEVKNGATLSINSAIINAGSLTIAEGAKLQINSLSGYNCTKGDYTLSGTDGTYGYQEGRILTYDLVTGAGSITLNGSVMLDETDITSSVTNGQYSAAQTEKVYEITGDYTGPVIEYNGASGETSEADSFIVHEGASLKITDTANSNGSLGKNVSGAGTLIIAAAANDSISFTGSSMADFTGTVDVISGAVYLGNVAGENSGAAADFAASKIIVRNGAAFWTHMSAETLGADIDLLSGATLGNKDKNNDYQGNIRFNIADPDAETASYNKDGVVTINQYWQKNVKFSGRLEGDGIVQMKAANVEANANYELSNASNTFAGTYKVIDGDNANNSGKTTTLKLSSATAAQYATIDLASTGAVSVLKLAGNSTIAALYGSDADNYVTTDATGTLTVSEGSFGGKMQNGSNATLSLTKTGSGTLTLSGTVGASGAAIGTITASGGELNVLNTSYAASAQMQGGNLTFGGNATHTVTGELKSSAQASIGKLLTVESGATLAVGSFNNAWGINTVVNGKLTATTMNQAFNNSLKKLEGAGSVTVGSLQVSNQSKFGASVSELNVTGNVTMSGYSSEVEFSSAQTTIGGTTTVNSEVGITDSRVNKLTFAAGNASLTGTVTNQGIINANDGTVEMEGAVNNAGIINLKGATVTMSGGISGTGTVALSGGSLALGSGEGITNEIAQFNYSSGTLTHGGLTVTNATFSGATLDNTTNGTLTLNGTLNVTNIGGLTKGEGSYSGGTVEGNGYYTGSLTVITGNNNLSYGASFEVQLNGTALTDDSTNTSYYTKSENGTLTLNVTDTSTFIVNTGTESLTYDTAEAYHVAAGATLEFSGTQAAGAALTKSVTGTGTVKVVFDTSNHNESVQFGDEFNGVLEVSGYMHLANFRLGKDATIKLANGQVWNQNATTSAYKILLAGETEDAFSFIGSELTLTGVVSGSYLTTSASMNLLNTDNNITQVKVTGGTTNLNAGTYGTVKSGGGTTNINGGTVGALTIYGGSINLSNGGTLTSLNFTSSDGTTSGSAGGSVHFKKNGETATTYTVGTITTSAAVSWARSLTVDKGVTLNVDTFSNAWGMDTMTIDGELAASTEIKLATGNQNTSKNIITGSGIVSTPKLIIDNAGTYNFSGVTLKIGEGGLVLGNGTWGAVPVLKLGAMTIEATDDWTAASGFTTNLAAADGKSTVINTAGHRVTINGSIEGSGALTKSGEGTLTLSGTNTYTGATTIEAGILEISKVAAVNSSSGVEMESGAGLKYTGSGTETLSTPLSGAGSFTMAGSGTLTLSGANTYTGATTIESGTLQIAELSAISSSSGVSISSGAELKYTGGDATLSKALSGAGSFTVAGTGTLIVSATLSHTGGTTIESGTLKQSGNNSVLGEGKNVTVKNGATLDVNGQEAYYNLTLGGGDAETAAVLTNTGDAVGDTKKQLYSITLADDATVTGTSGMCMIAGSHGQANLTLNEHTLTKTGSNTFIISRANVTAGTIKVLQGTVLAKQAGDSGSGSLNLSAASVYVGNQGDSFGTFELDSVNQSVKDLTFDGGKVSTLNQKTLTATGTTQVKSTGGTLSGNLTATDKVSFENGGALKLGTSGKLKVQNAENSAQYIELSGSADASGITATSESSQLAQLAEDASFTIQDMTLSNVKLSAVEGASVTLNNVSGTAELAGAGNYTLGMVGAMENDNGGTALTLKYTSDLAITMSGTGSQLLLSADPTVDANGIFGTYNLTLTLNYTLAGDLASAETVNWQDLVGFTGVLGDLLTAQTPEATVDLAEGEAAVAAAGTTPTVEYNYTAPGEGAQVGSLVITINGLNVPEPATSTLSLLALAALAARRRRK